MSVASRTILSNFFEEQCPQSHPQYLSGLSRALFPTTFLEIEQQKFERMVREATDICLHNYLTNGA